MGYCRAGSAFGLGVCLGLWLTGVAVAQQIPTTEPVGTLPSGWEQVDQRLVFLTVELSSDENSLNAINKAIKVTGYQQATKAQEAERDGMGNEIMNRNGGGPIPWQEFYGRTAAQFFYHPSGSFDANIRGGRVGEAEIHANYNGAPLYEIAHPPQLDYIYQANSDDQLRAEADAARLGQQIDKLLTRRRVLEAEQSTLWCKIAFRAVSSRDLTEKPLYLFEPMAPATSGSTGKQQSAAIAVGRDFLFVVDLAVDQAQQDVDAHQGPVYVELAQTVGSARSDMQRRLVGLGFSSDLQEMKSPLGMFAAAAKRLQDSSENMSDAFKLAMDSDAAGDDERKSDFRGQLQQMVMDFAAATITADRCLSNAAAEWKVVPDPTSRAPEPTLNWVLPANPDANSTANLPAIASPVASPPLSPSRQVDGETPVAMPPVPRQVVPALTPAEQQIVAGLQFSNFVVGTRRKWTYTKSQVIVDNETGHGRLDVPIKGDVFLLCVDGSGRRRVLKYTNKILIAENGPQTIGFSGMENKIVQFNNGNEWVPRNAFLIVTVADVPIYQSLWWPQVDNDGWWKDDSLVVKGQ